MATPDNKDLLAAFSPFSEYFAISSGDGRIKIWDTLKGQLQTEFANITSPDDTGGIQKKLAERGHLSLDYKCMQWVQLGKKKKKSGNLLLVLGTGGGDILALDVAAGILKWKVSDCHPGGVSSVSFSRHGSLYTGGVDGMVCKIDPSTGNLLGKFRASTKAISALSVSADGRTLATAASQLKIFSSADYYKKIQKFSGHPVGVRCITFTEDGKYVLTSGVGEKFVAIWKIDGRKKQTAVCVLSMEHPAVFLDSKGTGGSSEDSGFCILAVSEIGLCYFWCGKNAEELGNCKPTNICLSVEHRLIKKKGNKSSAIYSAKFQDILTPFSALVLFAYGSMVKPSFEKLSLQAGIDINLTNTRDQLLLPIGQTDTQKARAMQTDVTALDRANAEDAMLPIPKLYDSHKKRKNINTQPNEVLDHVMVEPASNVKNDTVEAYEEKVEEDNVSLCLEDRLKSVGILRYGDDVNLDKSKIPSNFPLDISLLKEPHILGGSGMTLTAKKIKSTILSMSSSDALKFLEMLMLMWKRRSISEKSIFPWISGILVNHGKFIASQESSVHLLASLKKMTVFKSTAAPSLLRLSGRLQLFMAQANRSTTSDASHFDKVDETEIEEDDDIDEVIYGVEEDTSESDVESDAMDDRL